VSRAMVSYPFPLKAGVVGRITLPEDLSEREAARVGRFVGALAVDWPDEKPSVRAASSRRRRIPLRAVRHRP